MKTKFLLSIVSITLMTSTAIHADEYIGQYSINPLFTNSLSNQLGAGSSFNPNSINNSYGRYGSEYSNESAMNPYATNAPKLYDSEGNYRGRLSTNQFDPDSISNEFGRYGSEFSSDSINNEFGAGNQFNPDSPANPFGRGLMIYGQ